MPVPPKPQITNGRSGRLFIVLDSDALTLKALIQASAEIQGLLNEVNKSITRGTGWTEWEVTKMSHSSPAMIEMVPLVRRGRPEQGMETAEAILNDLDALDKGGKPKHLGFRALGMAESLGNRGALGLSRIALGLIKGDHKREVEVTERIVAAARDITATRYRETGGIEGRIEVASIRKSLHISVSESVTGRNVECNMEPDLLQEMAGLLGRYAEIRGEVSFDSTGRPTSVRVGSYRLLDEGEPVHFKDLVGLYKDSDLSASRIADYWRQEE